MPREYQFPFELRHLVYFHEVARHLHFRKAAEALAVAQPALSRQISQLEAAVGAALFVRSSRKVELTAAGRKLQAETEPLLKAIAELPRQVRAVAEGQEGHLRISFTGLAMATVLPGILREFHRRRPGIRLELSESPTARQIEALQAREIACGFFHPEGPAPGLETRLLVKERNGVLLPAEHPLASGSGVPPLRAMPKSGETPLPPKTRSPRFRARGSGVPPLGATSQSGETPLPLKTPSPGFRDATGGGRLRLRDLADTPFVLFPRSLNPGYYDRTLAAFAQAGVTPQIAEEVWPRSNGIGLVEAGMGAMVLAPSEARHLPPEVVFRELSGPAPESRLVAGWYASAVEPTLLALIEVIDERFHSLRRPGGGPRPPADGRSS